MIFNSPELIRVSVEGDLASVRTLVESGADVNSTDAHGMGPLLTFTLANDIFVSSAHRGAFKN
jgi:hypothetical protein